jgi:hypothetical protein
MNGGTGADRFYYGGEAEGVDTITGFVQGPGGDLLNLHDMLVGFSGYNGANAFTGQYVTFVPSGLNSTLVLVDSNGGGDSYTPLVEVVGVTLAQSDVLV